MNIISGIVMAILTTSAVMLANWTTQEGEKKRVENNAIALAIVLGIVVGLAWIFVPVTVGTKLAFLAPIATAVMVCVMIGFIVMWARVGTEWREFFAFVACYVLMYLVTRRCARVTAKMISNEFWGSLVKAIPILLLIVAIGVSAIDLLGCRYRRKQESSTYLLRLLAIVLTIGAFALVLGLKIKWSAIKMPAVMVAEAEQQESNTVSQAESVVEAPAETTNEVVDTGIVAESVVEAGWFGATDEVEGLEEPVEEFTSSAWYKFYNLYLQLDADPLNDFNFGPNPFKEGMTAEDFRRDFYTRLSSDPAFAAGALAWLDANVGTRYLGEFYESCKGDWAKTINLTKEKFMADQALFYQTVAAAIKFFDTAKVELDYRTDGMDDQMYMNPFTPSGVPDVVVMTTKDHGGYFLTFVFSIKADQANAVEQPRASYRIDCGYQPWDVEKVMNIKPDDTPRTENPGHSTPPSDSGPNHPRNPGGQDDPGPEPGGQDDSEPDDPGPEAKYVKDPTKGTQGDVVKPNDDPGPGPDTNNGEGAQHSTKDQKENSDHMTQGEYNDTIKELKEINQTQKTGEDSSTPSSSGPADTKVDVDNNADTGNGGAPINTPTEVTRSETIEDDPISEGMIGAPD